MANYNIVSDIGEAIVKLLREGMVPDIIPNTEGIGVCHPSDKGDVSLGVCLYDIRRNNDIDTTERIAVGADKLRAPSFFLDLYYMITAYSSSDIKFRSLEEAKIIGRAIQLIEGNPVIKPELYGNAFANMRFQPRLEMLDLDNEEKHRIWNIPDTPYKLSVFYKVYPVEIESERVKSITRVSGTDFIFGQIGSRE
ncbi:MAG: DUF4255 domain-containing protein [Ruminiclostridium sp.]|jgi:hypothetical protein|nr:DUF4255 domain-containing protein [Ruminiclostridium sp.]